MEKTEDSCIRGCANVDLINDNIKDIDRLNDQIESTAKILNLIGNETRLKILYIINREHKVCVCDLGDILGVSVSAISQQLRKLKDGDLLKSKKEGQTIYYRVHPKSGKTLDEIFKVFNYELVKKVAQYE